MFMQNIYCFTFFNIKMLNLRLFTPGRGSKLYKKLNCQKDVNCQIIKHLDYGGGSQKKIK